MTDFQLNRRDLLAGVGASALSVSVWGCGRRDAGADLLQDKLLRVARFLYPHDSIDDAVYQTALKPLFALAELDPDTAQTLREGAAALDQTAGGDWLSAVRDEQLSALAKLEGGEFFAVVKDEFRTEFYEQPAVWELIGYEGPSAPYGGYINRGFDDIDWLPEG